MKKKTRKKTNKNDEIIQLLREILEELRKLNRETDSNITEEIFSPLTDGTFRVIPCFDLDNNSTSNCPSGWQIDVYYK